jgi:APA family basic amino acid/polyamine antiporter
MKAKLAPTLGLRDLTLLIIGAVIGSGIFTVPGSVFRQVDGSVTLALLVWLVGGVLSLLGALTYGELSATNPATGGLYVYVRDSFGRLPAFLYGWTLLFAVSSGANAALAVAFSTYLGELVPLAPWAATAVSLGMVAVVAAVNVRGTRESADLQNWTTAIKVGALVVMSALLLLLGRAPAEPAAEPAPAPAPAAGGSLVAGFGLALIGVLWAYEGWQYCTYCAGEVAEPQRNFPRAFLVGTAALIVVYLLANLGYLAAVGPAQAAATDRIATTAVASVAVPAAANLVALAIMVSVFSAANSTNLTAPRVYYAMAADGLFFRWLAQVHPRFGTPANAIVVGAAWSAVLVLTGTFEQLLTYVVFTGWIFYALAAASIFVYRRRRAGAARAYSVPGYPVTPLVFILAAAALVLNTVLATPRDAAFGTGLVLLGVPVYFIWQWHSKRAVPAPPSAGGTEQGKDAVKTFSVLAPPDGNRRRTRGAS